MIQNIFSSLFFGSSQSETTSFLWGIAVPLTIFIIAFGVTWFLYRHFRAQQ